MGRLQGYKNVVVEHIRSEYKFYASIVAGTMLALGWFNTNFLTTAQAKLTHEQMIEQREEADREIRTGVNDLKVMLTTQIRKQSLSDIKTAIKTNESETFQLERLIETESPREQDRKRLQQLKMERTELEIRRQCIISGNKVCD